MSMTSILRAAACALLLTMAAQTAVAQVVSNKGMGSIVYEGRLDPAERQEAIRRANLSAMEGYVAETWLAKAKIFASRRDELATKLDRLILGSTVLSETEDKKARSYSVVVRTEINAALLRIELDGGSTTASTNQSQKSLITLLFMARMQDSVQTFQARDYNRSDASVSQQAKGSYSERTREGENIGGSSIGTSGSIDRNGSGKVSTSVVTETGGSSTQRADKVGWKVTNAAEINTAMSGVFSGAGYEAVDADYVEGESRGLMSLARIRSDYSKGDDLTSEVTRSMVAGVKAADIPYIAIGTLDVGLRDTDPATGNVRVYVTVLGKVLDVRGRFPRTVSSVGPVQFAGLGPNETVARTNALTIASEKAAQTMVDELNVRNVR